MPLIIAALHKAVRSSQDLRLLEQPARCVAGTARGLPPQQRLGVPAAGLPAWRATTSACLLRLVVCLLQWLVCLLQAFARRVSHQQRGHTSFQD